MMMAGTALYISYAQKEARGISWSANFPHVVWRCIKLLALGTALHCVYAGKLVWELWNVLTQLSFTTLVAYLIIRRSAAFQIVAGLVLVLLSDVLYRTVLVPGFDQPWVEMHNFGAYVDTLLMGKVNTDGWVAINCLPTAAHTIWGAVAGKWLISSRTPAQKIRLLVAAGAVGLVAGYALDLASVTPIIKRICTGSFVLVSAGWVFLILAFTYWIVDIRGCRRYAWIVTIVGMNALFIYLFFETVGKQWLNPTVGIFVGGIHLPEVCTALVAWFLEWYLCYWLYKRKVFFKL
jgi:predicted acyltransferase